MTHASLFSGIGGPEIAAQMVGWNNIFHCEIRPLCRQVLNYWFPNSKSYEDIKTTDFTEWRGKVDVLTGGFPCQPFSTAGRRGGAEDDRYLWPEMLRAIRECRPTWVVSENVDGLLTMVESPCDVEVARETTLFDEDNAVRRYRRTESFTIERVCQDLEDIGYSVKAFDIPAASVGAPHRRNRVFIVAHRNVADTESSTMEADGHEYGEDRPKAGVEFGGSDRGEVTERRTDATSSYTPSQRRREIYEQVQSKLADGAEPFGNGRERNVTDTQCEGLQARLDERGNGIENRDTPSWGCGSCSELYPENRWRTFPSVSPVYRGNDGLPFYVDNLSIPFTKWRRFSLESYGNAIVPQVMYEIFRVIDKIENEVHTT